eukprot:Skav217791  [mRNA]  locus=scaffold1782:311054:323219:- [translate_table: standard]
MAEKGLDVKISLSSQLSVMARAPLHVLLQPTRKVFGTLSQTEDDPPWIEIYCPEVLIKASAIGLQHGWSDNGHRCRAFAVEARKSGGEDEIAWKPLLQMERLLLDEGEVIQIPSNSAEGKEPEFFNNFRVRMTGGNGVTEESPQQVWSEWLAVYFDGRSEAQPPHASQHPGQFFAAGIARRPALWCVGQRWRWPLQLQGFGRGDLDRD